MPATAVPICRRDQLITDITKKLLNKKRKSATTNTMQHSLDKKHVQYVNYNSVSMNEVSKAFNNSVIHKEKSNENAYNPFEAENIFQLLPLSETPSPAPVLGKTRSPNF